MTLNEFYDNLSSGKNLRAKSWGKDEYICLKNGKFINEKGEEIILHTIDLEEFEVYIDLKDPKNWVGKLCWFWGVDEEQKKLAILTRFDDGSLCKFGAAFGWYKDCCPLTREEVEQYLVKEN